MITVSVNGNINYLDKNNPDIPYRIVKGHDKSINSFVMNEDGSKYYTTSYEGKCLRWNPAVFNIEECQVTDVDSIAMSVQHLLAFRVPFTVNPRSYELGLGAERTRT